MPAHLANGERGNYLSSATFRIGHLSPLKEVPAQTRGITERGTAARELNIYPVKSKFSATEVRWHSLRAGYRFRHHQNVNWFTFW